MQRWRACVACGGRFPQAHSWDQAYSDARNSGVNAVRTLDATLATRRWSTEVGPLVASTPIVAPSGVVHIGNFAGAAVGINPDGSVRFRRRLGEHIVAPPALDPQSGELIYLVQNPVSPTDFGSFVYRVSPEGVTLASSAEDVHTTGPAKIWGNFVFVTDRANAYVFDRVTLELVAKQFLWVNHCVALVCAGDDFFATIGNTIWCAIRAWPSECLDRLDRGGPVQQPTVAVLDGPAFTDDPAQPLVVVTNQHCASAWRFRPGAAFNERLQYAWDRRYVQITCSSSERLRSTSPAVVADGRVVFGDQVGNVVSLDPKTGEQLWFHNGLGSVQAPAVALLRQIYVVGWDRLTVLDSDGTTISTVPLEGIGNMAALSVNHVHVVTSAGVLSFPLGAAQSPAFDPVPTGIRERALVQAGVAIGRDGTVFVSTPRGWVYAYGP